MKSIGASQQIIGAPVRFEPSLLPTKLSNVEQRSDATARRRDGVTPQQRLQRGIGPRALFGALSLTFGTLSAASEAAPVNVYSAGHADIVALYQPAPQNSFTIGLDVQNGTVNGTPGISAFYQLSDVVVATTAKFQRPDDIPQIALAFEPLGVPAGEEVFWLPQNNTEAAAAGVPFLGIRNEAQPGQLQNDQIHVELVSVSAPGNIAATFSLWDFATFLPNFAISSADGISDDDTLSLPIGHDHFNMGFGPEAAAGLWTLGFEVSATPAVGNPVTQSFQLQVRTGTTPVPLFGHVASASDHVFPFGGAAGSQLGLGTVLIGLGFVGLRRPPAKRQS
jgi:hypothetical protein